MNGMRAGMEIKRNKSKSICIHPWSHLAINPNGEVIPCCHARWKNPVSKDHATNVMGSIHKNNLDEIFNSDFMKNLRKQMINGILPEDVCGKCKYYEDINVKSPRQWTFKAPYAPAVEKLMETTTLEDGTLTDYKIKYWDLRYSNRCNMSCIMCSPMWSHKWTAEIKKLDSQIEHLDNKKKLAHALVYDRDDVMSMPKTLDLKNLDWVDNGIKDVEKIYFAGGEPLIMDEHWYILDKLDQEKRYDTHIKYNTNMLKLDHRGKNVIDYWKKWDKQHLFVECSIDETNERAEYIRNGTVWKTVSKNIRDVINAGIRISPIISVGCYNIHRLPELIEELRDLFQGNGDKVFRPTLNPVFTKAYSMSVWPDKQAKRIQKKLRRWEKKTKNVRPQQLKPFYDMLEKPHDPDAAKAFLRKSAILDISRNKNIFEIIPELEIVNTTYNDLYTRTKAEFLNSTYDDLYNKTKDEWNMK